MTETTKRKASTSKKADEKNQKIDQPASTINIDEIKDKATQQFKSNLDYFKSHLKALYDITEKSKPKSEILWLENGDINIREGNVYTYKKGAKSDATQHLRSFIAKPSRVVFGKPEIMFENDPDAQGPVEGDYTFFTQKYDDKNTDSHAEVFFKQVGPEIAKQGFTLNNNVTKEKDGYFLVVYGVGCGYHIEALYDYYQPEVMIILEAEPDWLYYSSHFIDWKNLFKKAEQHKKKIRLIVEANPTLLLQKLNGAIAGECLLGLDGVLSFLHSHNPTLHLVFNEFNSSKTANLASFIGFLTDEYNMMKNSFRNLRSGTKRVLNMVRKKADVPVVIVGSGPSLEENIDFVKAIQDKAVIISSGSSLAVLLKNGIQPDFHTVLERAKAVYDRHKEAAEQFDLSKIHVVMTTTIWPGIDSFFKDVIYFFRPALSPLGVFCRDNAEILNGEGPQVTNTSFAFAGRLGFSETYLLGIDLGAADPTRPRAEKAWISPGVKQRELTIPVRGNFGRTVFTDKSLIQQRQTIENQIRTMKGGPVFNLGSGVKIVGAEPMSTKDVKLKTLKIDKHELVDQLVEQFPVYTRDRFISAWEASGVRDNVAEYISGMINALNKAETWDNQLLKKIEDINQYINKNLRKQYAPRLLRGSVLRICMYIQTVFLRIDQRDREKELFELIRTRLIEHLKKMERECYSLADELESEDEYFNVKLM